MEREKQDINVREKAQTKVTHLFVDNVIYVNIQSHYISRIFIEKLPVNRL